MNISELKILHAGDIELGPENERTTVDIQIQIMQLLKGENMQLEFIPGFVKVFASGKLVSILVVNGQELPPKDITGQEIYVPHHQIVQLNKTRYGEAQILKYPSYNVSNWVSENMSEYHV